MEDLRGAAHAARRHRASTAARCISTTSISAPRSSSGATRRKRLAAIVCDRHVTGPKLVLGDFNEWMRGLATSLLNEKLRSVDLQGLPAAQADAAHLPGLFPVLHLDHIYYAGKVEVVGVELPRTRARAGRLGSPAAGRGYPDRVAIASRPRKRYHSVDLARPCRPNLMDEDDNLEVG